MAVSDHIIPSRIGDYEILERLGGGGMAEVFLGCKHGSHGFEKRVAVKRIRPHRAAEEAFVRMLIDEARIAARLQHPNIAQIFELGEWEGTPFIIMEWVPGRSLLEIGRQLRAEASRMPAPASALVVAATCAALEYAHTRLDSEGKPLGIIHRDVSPANLLVSFEGEVKLIDFGIAKAAQRLQATMTGIVKGKWGYMSPEQARGGALDHRTDIFAAGVVLYELLAGTNPLHHENEMIAIERARAGTVPPPSSFAEVPPRLEQVCLKAMAADPRERFQRAGEMANALDAYLLEHPFNHRALAGWVTELFRSREASPARHPSRQEAPRSATAATVSLAADTSASPGSRLDPPRPAAPLEERETIEHQTALLEHTERLPGPVSQPRGDDRPPAVEARPIEPGASPARRRLLRGLIIGALLGTGLGVLLVAVLGEPEWPAPPAGLATPDLVPAHALSPELGARASDPLPDLAGALSPPPELGARPPDQVPERAGDIAVRVKLRQPPPVSPRTRYGWLTVVTLHGADDLWAQVWLDGRPIGTSTIYRRRTPAGDHLLEATRDGFKPARRRITLRPDRELKVQLHLTR